MSLPTPYYQDNAVTLYHGDCREIVPLLGCFDLILTDPPYGLQGASTDKNAYASFSDNADEVTALVNWLIAFAARGGAALRFNARSVADVQVPGARCNRRVLLPSRIGFVQVGLCRLAANLLLRERPVSSERERARDE